MTKALSIALVALITWAAATYEAAGRRPVKAMRSTRFIAEHTNHVLAKKCRSTYSSLRGSRVTWIRRHRLSHRLSRGRCQPVLPWYIRKQIWAGNLLLRDSSGDPWPNCPDPGDGSSWQATVNCENGGSWLDSPGYYRCGLQFDPHWELRFGRLCP